MTDRQPTNINTGRSLWGSSSLHAYTSQQTPSPIHGFASVWAEVVLYTGLDDSLCNPDICKWGSSEPCWDVVTWLAGIGDFHEGVTTSQYSVMVEWQSFHQKSICHRLQTGMLACEHKAARLLQDSLCALAIPGLQAVEPSWGWDQLQFLLWSALDAAYRLATVCS